MRHKWALQPYHLRLFGMANAHPLSPLSISPYPIVISSLYLNHRFFRVKTRDVIKQSLQYLQGLFIAKKRKNMTNMVLFTSMNRKRLYLPEDWAKFEIMGWEMHKIKWLYL